MIKPIRYLKTTTIDPQKLPKYKIYRPKNLKVTYEPLSFHKDQFNQPIKKPSKVFETQALLSSASYSLNDKRAFQNAYFSSIIRNRSTSLSSFKLEAWRLISETISNTICKSFNFFKNLHEFHIRFFFCQFSATVGLSSLFNLFP